MIINYQDDKRRKDYLYSTGNEIKEIIKLITDNYKGTFLLMTNEEEPENILITSNPYIMFDFIKYAKHRVFIQGFAKKDYKDIFGYLLDLYDIQNPNDFRSIMPDLSNTN